ncbi:hypothetical protein K1719_025086 [Acacia pycnantha]|nr:hypothetical protein K1719_025086 [Acacia pycnantha]
METSSQTISIESFSYSWLVNMKPSLEACVNIDASLDEASSFIEMDPRNTPSKRFFQRNSQEFKFDFPVSQSPLALVHADELFSNGYLTPLFPDSLKMESFSASVSSTSNLVLPPSSSMNEDFGVVIIITNRVRIMKLVLEIKEVFLKHHQESVLLILQMTGENLVILRAQSMKLFFIAKDPLKGLKSDAEGKKDEEINSIKGREKERIQKGKERKKERKRSNRFKWEMKKKTV